MLFISILYIRIHKTIIQFKSASIAYLQDNEGDRNMVSCVGWTTQNWQPQWDKHEYIMCIGKTPAKHFPHVQMSFGGFPQGLGNWSKLVYCDCESMPQQKRSCGFSVLRPKMWIKWWYQCLNELRWNVWDLCKDLPCYFFPQTNIFSWTFIHCLCIGN